MRIQRNITGEGISDAEIKSLLERGKKLVREENYPAAIECFVQVAEKQPRNAEAFNSLGFLSFKYNRLEDAYKLFEQAVRLQPTYVDALINLFDVSFNVHKEAEALKYLERALQLNPDLSEIQAIINSLLSQADKTEAMTVV